MFFDLSFVKIVIMFKLLVRLFIIKLYARNDIFKYGFKTRKCPPQYKDLMEFEDDLQKMISNVQFRRVNNDFQDRLKNDIRSIKSSKKIFFFADKTRNIYEMKKITLRKTLDRKHHKNI